MDPGILYAQDRRTHENEQQEPVCTITVTSIDGSVTAIDINPLDVVLTLKELLRLRQGIPVQAQQLFSLVEEEPLENDRAIADIVAQGGEVTLFVRAETIALANLLCQPAHTRSTIFLSALGAWCDENGESVQALSLSGCVFESVECFQMIARCCPILQSVDCSDMHLIGDGGIRDVGIDDTALIQAYITLLSNEDLTEFYARGTRLFSIRQFGESTAALIARLAESSSLTTINLSGTQMCSDGWDEEEMRVQALTTNVVPSVRFKSTALALLEQLKPNDTLTSLDLSYNRCYNVHRTRNILFVLATPCSSHSLPAKCTMEC
jgi:hypothetical protein